tara:strand:- start:781 stop:1923 length:1143 start_codon:yes stop_codon:yes gene_type:complete
MKIKMIKSNTNYYLHNLLKPIKGNKILDYRFRTRIDEKYIPQYFNNNIVFQSFASFQQNNLKLSKLIRKFVKNNIKTNSIQAFGGESYLYSDNKKDTLCYSNSQSILSDIKYNGYENIKKVDYNKEKFFFTNDDIVLNLSKLNQNLIKQINNSCVNRIIIINCHHKDFWKKIKLLTNFKLMKREKYIDYKLNFFITGNIFVRKSFISLGGNCSVTYQLNKYNLRKESYPFDWSKIKINKIKDAIENNFNNYNKVEIAKYSENHKSWLLKNNYAMFAHEYLEKYNLEEFENKLIKRINNFKKIKNPIFIRIETYSYKNREIYIKYWEEIIKTLKKNYKNFKIILISKFNPNKNEIKWYPYNEFSKEWQNNHLEWEKIFLMY